MYVNETKRLAAVFILTLRDSQKKTGCWDCAALPDGRSAILSEPAKSSKDRRYRILDLLVPVQCRLIIELMRDGGPANQRRTTPQRPAGAWSRIRHTVQCNIGIGAHCPFHR
jgi:hypothetical protein